MFQEDNFVLSAMFAGLAGGLFANVRINQEIHELPEVERCFVHPGMTDSGIGVGAALAAMVSLAPFISTLHPADVIEDPAIMLITVAGLFATTQALSILNSIDSRPR